MAAGGVMDVQGGLGRTITPTTADDGTRAWYGTDDGPADIDILVRISPPNPITDLRFAILARADDWADTRDFPLNGYMAQVRPGVGTLRIRRWLAGSGTTAEVAYSFTAGVDVWARFQCQGNDQRLRVWDVGSAEPGTWDLTTAHTDFASGRWGVAAAAGSGMANLVGYWDNFTVIDLGGSGGDPDPPPGDLTLATAENTGATEPAGGWAETLTGLIYVDTPGAVIEDWHVTGQIRVRAANVTIRNCHVIADYVNQPGIWAFFSGGYEPYDMIVEDCTVVGLIDDTPAGSGIVSYQECRRCNVTNCADGLKGGSQPGEITEQNYIHHLRIGWTGEPHEPGVNNTHCDGIQWQGADGAIVRYNAIHGPYYDGGGPDQPDDIDIESSVNGGIFFKTDSGPCTDLDIYENRVWGFGSNLILYSTGDEVSGSYRENDLGSGQTGGYAIFGATSLVGSPATTSCGNHDQTGALLSGQSPC